MNHLKGTFKPSERKQGKACPRGPRLPTLSYSASRLTCFLPASLCLCPSLSVPLSLFPSHLGFRLGSGSSLTLPRGPRGIAGSRGHQQERGPHGVTASTQCGWGHPDLPTHRLGRPPWIPVPLLRWPLGREAGEDRGRRSRGCVGVRPRGWGTRLLGFLLCLASPAGSAQLLSG